MMTKVVSIAVFNAYLFFVFPDGQYLYYNIMRGVVYCISFVSNVCSTSMCIIIFTLTFHLSLPDGNTFGLQMVPSLVHLLKSSLN